MSIPASSAECPPKHEPCRVIAYIDGFNLYYGLKAASRDSDYQHIRHGGDPADCLGRSLYWLDLQAVILGQLRKRDKCVAIKYFSAPRGVPKMVAVDDEDRIIRSNERQRIYLEALGTLPLVELVMGWYSENEPHTCACGNQWPNFEEKVTDVNMATHMLCDAHDGRMDRALVMSADADLVPVVTTLRSRGTDVLLTPPPGRKRAKHLRQAAGQFQAIRIRGIRDKLLPDRIDREGLPPIERPDHWKRPGCWPWTTQAPSEISPQSAG